MKKILVFLAILSIFFAAGVRIKAQTTPCQEPTPTSPHTRSPLNTFHDLWLTMFITLPTPEPAKPCSSSTNLRGPAPSGDVQSLAQQILANSNITYWTNNGVNTRDVLIALSEGKPAYTTCGNAPNKTVDVNPNILKFVLDAASQTHVMINALTDKCHDKPTSHHYNGEAVDLDLGSGPLSILNPIASKYGGTKNYETSHHHFDFPK